MKKLLNISVVSLLALQACMTPVPLTLDDTYYTPTPEKVVDLGDESGGMNALAFNGGNLLEGNWWTGANGDMTLKLNGDGMEIKCVKIGPKYTPFGMEMGAVDFTGGLAIKMVARAEGETNPMLALQMDDFEGIQANAKRPTKRIHLGDDFKDYYFKIDDSEVWTQSWPTNATVNGKLIQKFLVFPNPGGAGFTGTIFIKEMKVVRQADMGEDTEVKLAIGANGGVIADFKDGLGEWWNSGDNIPLSHDPEQGAAVIDGKAIGPKYACIGTSFKTMNVYNCNELEVWARVDPGSEACDMRIDLKDPDEHQTNAKATVNRIEPSKEFKKYTFNYVKKFKQGWPEAAKVDGQRINALSVFINGGGAPWTGRLYIQKMEFKFTGEVEVIDDTPKLVAEPENTSVLKATDKAYSWFKDEGVTVANNGTSTTLEGINGKMFGKAFRPVDFDKTPVLKVVAKADAETDLTLSLVDVLGVETSKGITKKITAGDFTEYTFDFSDLVDPKSGEKINTKEIFELVFKAKGGNKFMIKSIEAVSAN